MKRLHPSNSGFTLAEVLTCIAILLVLAALSFPLVRTLRQSANETTCVSNLRQFSIAISLYRSNEGKDTVLGKPSDMGLPLMLSRLPGAENLRCRGVYPFDCRTPAGYFLWPLDLPGIYDERLALEWSQYVQKHGEGAFLVRDLGHEHDCPATEFTYRRALGVTLGGSVQWKRGLGEPMNLAWWHTP